MKKLSDYLVECIKTNKFEDYMSVYPSKCARLLQHLLNYQTERLADEREINSFS